MKNKVVLIFLLMIGIALLLDTTQRTIKEVFVSFTYPIKQRYATLIRNGKQFYHTYIAQTQEIKRLQKENISLKHQLILQRDASEQLIEIKKMIPHLKEYPKDKITITYPVAYLSWNNTKRILLQRPHNLPPKGLYGLVDKGKVAGVAKLQNNQLVAYLNQDKKCSYSVHIGKYQAPGIATGSGDGMVVKFIPKWHEIAIGDEVYTSGLDGLFFKNIPVGKVVEIGDQSAYSTARIRPYTVQIDKSPLFLITDANATYFSYADEVKERTKQKSVYSIVPYRVDNQTFDYCLKKAVQRTAFSASSIPDRIDQTKDEIALPELPQEKREIGTKKKKAVIRQSKKVSRKKRVQKKQKQQKVIPKSTIDLF